MNIQEAAEAYGENKLPLKFFAIINEFQKVYPDAALTGTCALLLFGFDLNRDPTDIDFIIPKKPLQTDEYCWEQFKMPNGFTAEGYFTFFRKVRIEVIVWDEWGFQTLREIKVTKLENLLEAKRDLGMTGTLKHIDDFWKITNQLLAGSAASEQRIEELLKALKDARDYITEDGELELLTVLQVIDQAIKPANH